jgi:2-octaprenyl-6-methoxyphenol hydroxylase
LKIGEINFFNLKNYKLYNLLKKTLSKNKFFKAKFVKDLNLSFLQNYELIINCDPFNLISKRYFSKKIVKNYNSYAYTTLITHEKIKNDTALQIFTKKGPLAFLPISDRKLL